MMLSDSFASEKHLRDIAGMLELSSQAINFKTLDGFLKRYELEKVWRKARISDRSI